jgi:hypothetical protein
MALSQQPVRVAARDFFDGVAGNPKGGKKYPVQPEQPVEEALAQGRETGAVPEIAPASAQNQILAAILGSGLTVNEAATFTGMLPAAGKPVSAKDTVMAQSAQLSKELFESQVQGARELAKTDPQGAKAMIEKATEAHFNRQAGLVGLNPVQLAQAQLMGGALEEDQ